MKASELDCTDMFCGAGGSSDGARRAGVSLRMAMNHWQLAIDTHNSNFPTADLGDVRESDYAVLALARLRAEGRRLCRACEAAT